MPLLLTLSSGVQGFTTIHAGSARQALTRLRFICQLSETGAHLSVSALNTLVSDSVDVVVHCRRTPEGPRVTEIVAVEDLAGSPDSPQLTVTQLFERVGPGGPLQWSGTLPGRLTRPLAEAGYDVRSLLGVDRAESLW